MKLYSQRDPRWESLKLGTSPATVGRYGCTITNIAMLSDYFASIKSGKSNDPAYFAKNLQFTSEWYLIWESLPKVSTMHLVQRFKKENMTTAKMNELIRSALAAPKQACILQVNGNHWVLATGTVPGKNNEYKIADPFFGDRSTTARYGNKITGGAIISV